MSNHSFPPKLTPQEFSLLQHPVDDAWNEVSARLICRGLLYEVWAADGWPQAVVSKRGELMRRRYQRQQLGQATET